MILADTSALLPFLAGRSTRASELLADAFSQGLEVALTPIVVQEVLQGARDEPEWRRLKSYLKTQVILVPRDPMATHIAAARIYYDCRRRGLTVRSTLDCVVAQIAIEHGVPLLHDDRDYDAIARVRALKTLP
ncbi:MAG: PIN domain-containing protein [Thermoanaerobaculia bacterium]